MVNNLGLLYKSQGKLDEAEKMCQRALQGYEKKNVARYRPALNAICNLGDLFATQWCLDEAKEMYSRACTGFRVLLSPSSNECQLFWTQNCIYRYQDSSDSSLCSPCGDPVRPVIRGCCFVWNLVKSEKEEMLQQNQHPIEITKQAKLEDANLRSTL